VSVDYGRPPGRLGRPPLCPPETILRITALTDQGYTLRQIAELLNGETASTAEGRSDWYKSKVDRVTKTLHARDVIAQAEAT
jgi:hypothetical protein